MTGPSAHRWLCRLAGLTIGMIAGVVALPSGVYLLLGGFAVGGPEGAIGAALLIISAAAGAVIGAIVGWHLGRSRMT
jgi:membrane protein DedA with SNARE-associated domain